MKYLLQRLAPGFLMILAVSGILLITDGNRWETSSRSGSSLAQVEPRKAEFSPSVSGVPAGTSAARRWKIHLLEYSESTITEDCRRGIRQELEKRGMVSDRDYVLKRANAQGDVSTLSMMIDSTLSDRPDVILLVSTVTLQTALKKNGSIPMVFGVVANPLLAGVGKSFSEHQPHVAGNATESAGASIAQEAIRQRRPYLTFTSGQAIRGGAAIAVSRDYEQCGRDMVEMALQILHGEDPARMPIRQVSRTEIIINRRNAAVCGLEIPASLLRRADRVIE